MLRAIMHSTLLTAAVVAGYYLAARLGLLLQVQPENIAVFWPASGVAVGTLLALGPRSRIPVAAAVLIATAAANLLHGASAGTAVAFGLCNTLECLLAAVLIERLIGSPFRIDSLLNLAGFVAAALASTALAAFGAALALQWLAGVDRGLLALWGIWLESDLLGIIAVAPLFVGIASAAQDRFRIRRPIEGAIVLLLIAAASWHVYGDNSAKLTWSTATPGAFLLPLLLWVAARCHLVFSAAGSFIIAIVIVWNVTHGVGHLGNAMVPLGERVVAAQVAMLTMSLSAIALAALLSQQRRVETALRASEQRLRVASSAAGQGVFEWFPFEDRAVFENDRMFALLGRTSDDGPITAADFLANYVHPEDRTAAQAALEEARRTGGLSLECRVLIPTGEERYIEINGAAMAHDSGPPTRIVGVVTDITERRRVHEALRTADRRKDEFLAILGHELRNGLAPLQTTVDILKQGTPDATRTAFVGNVIGRQVGHLTRLVNDLLDASRISRGQLELNCKSMDLADAVSSALEMCRPAVEAKQHILRVDTGSSPLPVNGDHVRLAQAISNILVNAAKFTEPGGIIELTAKRDGDHVVVRVRDNGIGIEPEFLPHMFDAFSQGPSTRARADGGLGIGLMLVRQIASLHGGIASARSGGNGQGCEMEIRLPLRADLGAAAPSASPTERCESDATVRTGAGLRILVVDDNLEVCSTLTEMLTYIGHEVETAANGPSALEIADRMVPHVVLLDVRMPGMDGRVVADRLRASAHTSSILIIGLTGESAYARRPRSDRDSFDHVLMKPAGLAEIVRLIEGRIRSNDVTQTL